MTDATGATSYSYDADNRVTRIAQPNGTVDYSYDRAGHRTSVTAPGGKTATYAYDAANRLAGVTDWRGGATAYGYDAAGRTGAITYTNGVSAAYSYNDAGQLLGLTYQRGGATLATFSYTYDADGNRLTATDGGGTTTYGYDALDRLTGAQAPGGATGYTYDAAGNRTGVTTPGGATAYRYNAANELTAADATTYSYDADGNRLTATTGSATTIYGYDDANYLTGISSGAHAMVYTYNGDHARTGSAVDGVTTNDVLDLAAGLPTVLQQATSGVTTTYLYGAGLLGQDDGTDLQTLLPDALGSTRVVAGSGGAVVGHASYDAYGAQTTSGAGSVFGFTGQQTDAASGLVYLRARYYDPATGVFLQRDPYPFDPDNPVTIDRYSYANDNPVTFADPSGQSIDDVTGWLLSGIGLVQDAQHFFDATQTLAQTGSDADRQALLQQGVAPELVDIQLEELRQQRFVATLKPTADLAKDSAFAIYGGPTTGSQRLDNVLDLFGLFKDNNLISLHPVQNVK